MIVLPESDADLLAECEVDTFRSGGPGGQHVNKTESAVRLRHLPTGLTVSSQEERSQHRNKLTCLRKLRRKVDALNHRPPPRVKTRTPPRVKRKNAESKIKQSQKKRMRGKPSFEG